MATLEKLAKPPGVGVGPTLKPPGVGGPADAHQEVVPTVGRPVGPTLKPSGVGGLADAHQEVVPTVGRPVGPTLKEERFRSYNRWLQEKFGERVYKVIVDAGFTCPNRDGTVAVGGCAYCNNNSFRPPSAIKTDPIRDQVREGIEYIRKRFHANKFIIYFQPFSNTYAETEHLRRLYTDAIDHPEVVGLAIGTRPDCVDKEKIQMIDEIAQRTFVSLEFGVESIYDDTLRRVNRGHDYAAFLKAMELTRGRGIHIGAHLILGFPWETREQWLAMADEMSRAGIDALKIHHLHIVRGTALAAEYARQPFRVLGYEEYLDLLCEFVERLDPNIVIERMFGEAPFGLLVAPNWRRTKNDLVLDIKKIFEERDVRQGAKTVRLNSSARQTV